MMKRFFGLFFTFSLYLFVLSPAFASSSLKQGETLFNLNCSVCHLGGNNIIIPEKNLKKQTLEENGMNNLNAIVYQIINGKNGMPAFGGRLTELEIEEIAKYLLEASDRNFEN